MIMFIRVLCVYSVYTCKSVIMGHVVCSSLHTCVCVSQVTDTRAACRCDLEQRLRSAHLPCVAELCGPDSCEDIHTEEWSFKS